MTSVNTPPSTCSARPPLQGGGLNQEWLEPASIAAVTLEGEASRTAAVRDDQQFSPQHQVFSLEAFHLLILHFAPQVTGFSFCMNSW
ncbi:uncharacterized protein AKAME5_001354400 [Lates japonicus]|uniref:Uncharacterized protein n=1 Tax=Lates japonicus TaxID=270547 RepID=A0AAD3MXS0_LATJO|nr:uncharacterized protein AKAME5_001354400 [Lates japonicus]